MKRRAGLWKTTQVKPCFCPSCFKLLDATTSLGSEAVPQPGDFTVCIDCCEVLRWDAEMNLVRSSLLEIPMHSRLDFAKVVTKCKEMPRPKRTPLKPSTLGGTS